MSVDDIIKEKFKSLDKQMKRDEELFRRRYLNTVSAYDLSSPMGRRVSSSLMANKLESERIESMVSSYDAFCGTHLKLKSNKKNIFNKWTPKRVERLTTGLELSQKNQSVDCHQYSFTKRQRLEKSLRKSTGIDWKSRLIAFNCNLNPLLERLDVCPICGQDIEVEHSCDIVASGRSRSDPVLNNGRAGKPWFSSISSTFRQLYDIFASK